MLIGLTFLVMFFVISPGLLGGIRSIFITIGSDTSVSTRTSDYAAVAPFIRNSPWIGCGPGTFLPKFRVVDNDWLVRLIEVGVIGAVGMMVSFLTLGWLGSALRHSSDDPLRRALGQSLMGTCAVVIWACATWDVMAFQMAAGSIAVFLGIGGGLYATTREYDSTILSPAVLTSRRISS